MLLFYYTFFDLHSDFFLSGITHNSLSLIFFMHQITKNDCRNRSKSTVTLIR